MQQTTIGMLRKCVPRRSYATTAGGDATPSSSLPEKFGQIGPGAYPGATLHWAGAPLPAVAECHRHFGHLGTVVLRNHVDRGGHRPSKSLRFRTPSRNATGDREKINTFHITCPASQGKGGSLHLLDLPPSNESGYFGPKERKYFLYSPRQNSRRRATLDTSFSDVSCASDFGLIL